MARMVRQATNYIILVFEMLRVRVKYCHFKHPRRKCFTSFTSEKHLLSPHNLGSGNKVLEDESSPK